MTKNLSSVMSDSQRYPLNLYLSNNKEDIVTFIKFSKFSLKHKSAKMYVR